MVRSKLKALTLFFALMLLCHLQSCTNTHKNVETENLSLLESKDAVLDSVYVDFPFLPIRWELSNQWLIIGNPQDEYFASLYDLGKDSLSIQFARKGQGPQEYSAPGLAVTNVPDEIGIYEYNLDIYRINADSVEFVKSTPLPSTNGNKDIPQAYNQMIAIGETMYVANYFSPREMGIDLIDMEDGIIVSSVHPKVDKNKSSTAGEEFDMATNGKQVFISYRHFPIIKKYDVSNEGIVLTGIYNTSSEYSHTLPEQREDWMRCYSDIQCSSDKLYLLGNNLTDDLSHIEVFDVESMKCIANLSLNKSFSSMLLDRENNNILLYSDDCEDYIFKCSDL